MASAPQAFGRRPPALPIMHPSCIVLNDGGKKSTAEVVSDSVNRGEQVFALDLLFTGDNSVEDSPRTRTTPSYSQLSATVRSVSRRPSFWALPPGWNS